MLDRDASVGPFVSTSAPVDPVVMFVGEYAFLSNFWVTDLPICYLGHFYRTAEHAYQAAKCVEERDRKAIQDMATAGGSKRAGRSCNCRPDWEDVKETVMAVVVENKFQQNADLRDKLLATGDRELCEGNMAGDDFWGKVPVRMSGGQVREWGGTNTLGEILMAVRDKIRAEVTA